MRLGTQVGLFNPRQGSDQPKDTIHMMEQCAAAGFLVQDIGFCDAIRPGKPDDLSRYDWERRIDAIGEAAARLGVEFSQAHLPYDDLFLYSKPRTAREIALFREMTRRGIIACGRLGVKWAVVHPFTDTIHAEYDNAVNLATNREFYAPYVEFAEKNGTGLAFENMAEFSLEKVKRRYCTAADELIELVDSFGSSAAGICWDFGHAHSVYRDQTAALRKIGARLKATHVQDNRADRDGHLIPFIGGNIKWEAIMPTLVEIGYTGDFIFETHRFTQNIPDALRASAGQFAYEMGQYCLSLAK
ncbi:MAG: sugar phosphate isomerase/epimerase [Clostridia bacterium]|nr:sugar phosphate isomerase/epimerase [Clostridia bacterium]